MCKIDLKLDVFLVGGESRTFCCVPNYLGGLGCGVGYTSVFDTILTKNTKYSIKVELAVQATIVFGKTANQGESGQSNAQNNCSSNSWGDSGAVCGEFEISGTAYSGYNGYR